MKEKLKEAKAEILLHTICTFGWHGDYPLTSADPLAEGLEKAQKMAQEGLIGPKGPVEGFLIAKHITRPDQAHEDSVVILQPHSYFGKPAKAADPRDPPFYKNTENAVFTDLGALVLLRPGERIYDVKTGALTFEAK